MAVNFRRPWNCYRQSIADRQSRGARRFALLDADDHFDRFGERILDGLERVLENCRATSAAGKPQIRALHGYSNYLPKALCTLAPTGGWRNILEEHGDEQLATLTGPSGNLLAPAGPGSSSPHCAGDASKLEDLDRLMFGSQQPMSIIDEMIRIAVGAIRDQAYLVHLLDNAPLAATAIAWTKTPVPDGAVLLGAAFRGERLLFGDEIYQSVIHEVMFGQPEQPSWGRLSGDWVAYDRAMRQRTTALLSSIPYPTMSREEYKSLGLMSAIALPNLDEAWHTALNST